MSIQPAPQREDERIVPQGVRQADSLLQFMMDNVPALFSYIDREGRYRIANATYANWLGLRQDQVLGRTIGEVVGEPHKSRSEPFIEKALAGECVSYESQLRHRDGTLHDVVVQYTPKFRDDGTVDGFVTLVQDITDLKRAVRGREQTLAKLSAVLRSMAEAVLIFDIDGQVVEMNPAAVALFGPMIQAPASLDIADFVKLFELHRLDGTPVGLNDMPRMRALGGETFVDAEYRLKSLLTGAERIVSYNGCPLPGGSDGGRQAVLTVRDITERKQSEEALTAAMRVLSTHVENTPLAVMQFDADFRFQRWSKRAEELFGWTADEVIGKHPLEFRFLHEGDLEAAARTIDRLLAGSQEGRVQSIRNYRKDGTIRYCEWYNSSMCRPDGKVDSVFSFALDVTDRVVAQEALRLSEQRFRTALQQSPVVIFNQDRDLRYTWLYSQNEAAQAALGRTDAELLGFEEAAHLVSIKRDVMAAGRGRREEVRVVVNGCDRYFDVTVEPLRDTVGAITGITGAAVDTTERHQIEDDVRRSNEALRAANASLEEFTYVASHDLQEPLRMVHAYTELLLRRVHNPEQETLQYAHFIREGVRRMEALIRDVLSYSRTLHAENESGEPVQLATAMRAALHAVSGEIAEKGAVVEVDLLPTVRGNEAQLSLVFQNLLSNALKYNCSKPPRIKVSSRSQGAECILAIEDNGIGFNQKYAERVFGLFKRLHGNDYDGTGLGLAICKRIVERCGGRIWAESQPGVGSTFYIELSLAE